MQMISSKFAYPMALLPDATIYEPFTIVRTPLFDYCFYSNGL